MNPKLAGAYQICEQVVKKHSSSFYRAFSILPEKKRNAVWAVYACCRTIDDIVDETPDAAQGLVSEFELAFERMLNSRPSVHPHWQALADVWRQFPMEEQPFCDMITGQRQDLILRDVKEDCGRGRVYLLQPLMLKFGYSEADIAKGTRAPGWFSLFKHLADMAERYDVEGVSAQPYNPRDSRLALSAAGLFYRQILVESRLRHGDVFSFRVRVSQVKKMSIILSLLTQASTWKSRAAAAGESRLAW